MTHALTNPTTWGVGAEVTSAQINDLDAKSVASLDIRSGQTATIQSNVGCSGAGRVRPSYVVGANADTTYDLASGTSMIDGGAAALSAARQYTLSNTGAVAGDRREILGHATWDLTIKRADATTLIVLGAGNTGLNGSPWADFVFDGTHWKLLKSSQGSRLQAVTFTANGNYTVPPGVFRLLVLGAGGGGGGGGGGGTGTGAVDKRSTGGGGGGAAMQGAAWVDVTPGQVIAATIGAGGSAGAPDGNGGDGVSTTFGAFATFRGGQGGTGGLNGNTAGNQFFMTPGGGPVQGGQQAKAQTFATANNYILGVRMPGEGGYGGASGAGATSGALPHVSATTAGSGTTTAGVAGAAGATTTTTLGGGGGGGGGASAFGDGGTGGAGSAGHTSGVGAPNVGLPGTAGGIAAGGGGGGGCGCNSGGAFTSNGGAGGAGGSGALVVIPIR